MHKKREFLTENQSQQREELNCDNIRESQRSWWKVNKTESCLKLFCVGDMDSWMFQSTSKNSVNAIEIVRTESRCQLSVVLSLPLVLFVKYLIRISSGHFLNPLKRKAVFLIGFLTIIWTIKADNRRREDVYSIFCFIRDGSQNNWFGCNKCTATDIHSECQLVLGQIRCISYSRNQRPAIWRSFVVMWYAWVQMLQDQSKGRLFHPLLQLMKMTTISIWLEKKKSVHRWASVLWPLFAKRKPEKWGIWWGLHHLLVTPPPMWVCRVTRYTIEISPVSCNVTFR